MNAIPFFRTLEVKQLYLVSTMGNIHSSKQSTQDLGFLMLRAVRQHQHDLLPRLQRMNFSTAIKSINASHSYHKHQCGIPEGKVKLESEDRQKNISPLASEQATVGVSENWECHEDVISSTEAQQRQLWAFRFHGSYYNLVDRLERDRLHLFRGYQYKSDVRRCRLNRSVGLQRSKSKFGYDGPNWKRFWIRRRRPNCSTY